MKPAASLASTRPRQSREEVPIEHPLLDRARAVVTLRTYPGRDLRFASELDYEDAVQDAVVAMLTRKDPNEAARRSLAAAVDWRRYNFQMTGSVIMRLTGEREDDDES